MEYVVELEHGEHRVFQFGDVTAISQDPDGQLKVTTRVTWLFVPGYWKRWYIRAAQFS